MTRPILMYCYQQQLGLPKGTIDKLQTIQNRAAKIISPCEPIECWDTIEEVCNRRIAMDVFKCFNGLSSEQFKEYFRHHRHEKETRGNNSSLVLPSVRTETGKRMFTFQGARLFNSLPKDIRDKKSLVRFKQKLYSLNGC